MSSPQTPLIFLMPVVSYDVAKLPPNARVAHLYGLTKDETMQVEGSTLDT